MIARSMSFAKYSLVHLQLDPSSSRRLYIPVLPLKTGSIDVTIEGITGVNRDIVTQTITVVVRTDHSRITGNASLLSIERRYHQLLLNINAHFTREPTSADTRT